MLSGMLPIIEEFISLDGEGPTAGELAYFVRFADCNLRCSWCDTAYSWDGSVAVQQKTPQQIYDAIKKSGIHNVTLTGGEPLIQTDILSLLQLLAVDDSLLVHIETNGSVDITPFCKACPTDNILYILDYKLPASKMEHKMCQANLLQANKNNVYKFVIASEEDLLRAVEIVQQYQLQFRCQVFFSPVREQIDPLVIVEKMKEKQLNHVRLQLQLHKILWPKEMRGV